MERSTIFKNGKPSISIRAIYTMANCNSHNQAGYIYSDVEFLLWQKDSHVFLFSTRLDPGWNPTLFHTNTRDVTRAIHLLSLHKFFVHGDQPQPSGRYSTHWGFYVFKHIEKNTSITLWWIELYNITNWKITMFHKYKSTISAGPFSVANRKRLPGQ